MREGDIRISDDRTLASSTSPSVCSGIPGSFIRTGRLGGGANSTVGTRGNLFGEIGGVVESASVSERCIGAITVGISMRPAKDIVVSPEVGVEGREGFPGSDPRRGLRLDGLVNGERGGDMRNKHTVQR